MNHAELTQADNCFKKTGMQNDDLNQLIQPFYIRVTKQELKVPKANDDHIIQIDINEKEKELYRKIENSSLASLEKMIKLSEAGIVPYKTEDISVNIKDAEEKVSIDISKISLSSYSTCKIARFLQELEKSGKRKCVVWCLFVDTILIITKLLNEKGYHAKAIYGETEQKERERLITSFNTSDEVEILVTNPQTLAESVSLHKACHDAHYLELNYNLYHYLQSRDRIHRLGLKPTDETNYYIYINKYTDDINNSYDMKVLNALKKKEYKMLSAIEKGNFIFEKDGQINI